jgi:GNAT superfamily N-acetyltransferase
MQMIEASASPNVRVRVPVTINGERIEFVREENIAQENRGFIVDRIVARVNGEEVGYIKIENIPQKEARRFYKSIFNYLSQINGANYLPWDNGSVDYRTLSNSDLIKIITYNRFFSKPNDEYRGFTRDALLVLVEERKAVLDASKQGEAFREFLHYHVDKPFVAYIDVSRNRRREGIGTALYIEASNWMRERGLVFRSSKCQTKEAQAVWASFEAKGMTRKDNKGRSILYPNGIKGNRA